MSTIVENLIARFEGVRADFWDCDDDTEQLSHTDVLEAIQDYLQGFLEEGDVEEQLREIGPIEVYPWTRNAVSVQHVDDATEQLLERAAEILDEDEELGDPDGDHEILPESVVAKYRAEMRMLVERLYGEANVWGCTAGAAITIETEELIALVREQLPELLDP